MAWVLGPGFAGVLLAGWEVRKVGGRDAFSLTRGGLCSYELRMLDVYNISSALSMVLSAMLSMVWSTVLLSPVLLGLSSIGIVNGVVRGLWHRIQRNCIRHSSTHRFLSRMAWDGSCIMSLISCIAVWASSCTLAPTHVGQ